MKLLGKTCIILMLISSISCAYGKQVSHETNLSDSLVCLDATRKIEAEYNIPPHILSAIALTETGRSTQTNSDKVFTPWPWTTNIKGQGFYFKNKTEALEKIKTTLASGEKLFDVGCMQINWYYHGEAFSSLEEALNPYHNVRYAAEFLLSLYEKTKSWTAAVERYHSATPVHYQRYRRVVADNWDRARDLMSPIDGSLHHLFVKQDNQVKVSAVKPDQKSADTNKNFKIARMREIAKLRARVRLYAQNNY